MLEEVALESQNRLDKPEPFSPVHPIPDVTQCPGDNMALCTGLAETWNMSKEAVPFIRVTIDFTGQFQRLMK
jgi:hypothetical protein